MLLLLQLMAHWYYTPHRANKFDGGLQHVGSLANLEARRPRHPARPLFLNPPPCPPVVFASLALRGVQCVSRMIFF